MYKNKYLKYKFKYLNLKKGGSISENSYSNNSPVVETGKDNIGNSGETGETEEVSSSNRRDEEIGEVSSSNRRDEEIGEVSSSHRPGEQIVDRDVLNVFSEVYSNLIGIFK